MSGSVIHLTERIRAFEPALRIGTITRVSSTYLEADGPDAPLGSVCAISHAQGETLAALISAQSERVILAPLDPVGPIRLGAATRLVSTLLQPAAGDAFLGRAVDGLGRPIDGGPPPVADQVAAPPTPVLHRTTRTTQAPTGLKAIDALLPLAVGQRIGLFAAPGVGKTTLMGQLATQIPADRCVICLVGERGREVEAIWSSLDETARARTVLVAATSDETAALRAQAVEQALALAGRWRREGHHVLLVLDSATRYAMALREIGLAAGEPPTVRAYTPGVFAALPRLVERCGAVRGSGAITAVMTVLSETDDVDDPITEVMKSLLDGHIVLSRRIADQGRYPAIDVPRSISRLGPLLMSADHKALAGRALASLSAFDSVRTLIDAGVYTPGSNPETDAAVRRQPALEAFLTQADPRIVGLESTLAELRKAVTA